MDMPETHRKLEVAGTPRVGTHIVVSDQNLDTNGHVNNAQYVLMAEQAVEDTGRLSAPMRICVQYRMQAHLGDVLVPTVHEQDGTRTVVLADEGGEAYTVVSFAPLAPALALS
jgi:acyl-ACP thioesterase